MNREAKPRLALDFYLTRAGLKFSPETVNRTSVSPSPSHNRKACGETGSALQDQPASSRLLDVFGLRETEKVSLMPVAVIDDDEAVCDSLSAMLESQGIEVRSFRSADAFIAHLRPDQLPSCVICDVWMPGLSGLDLQKELAKKYPSVPVILITGHGHVDMAVAALKSGAQDFMEKPLSPDKLVQGIRSAIEKARHRRQQDEDLVTLIARVDELSERQRQVMKLAVQGLSNKEIAATLKISPRTVETYRAWVMEKTGARNIAELVSIAMRIGEFRQ